MSNVRLLVPNIFVVSVCVLCFEIIATRITSVIFVNHFAFVILSLSILGLSSGGIYAYYRTRTGTELDFSRSASIALFLMSISLTLYTVAVTRLPFIENIAIYFFLLFLPFFFAGIFYALAFQSYAIRSFTIYAADLIGAAVGALAALAAITFLGPVPTVILLSALLLGCALSFAAGKRVRKYVISGYAIVCAIIPSVILTSDSDMLGTIPIGKFPGKDFHYVYSDSTIRSEIIDSRWSIFGRSDLVQHSHQDMVRHLFIDGAAGTSMYRFDGNVQHPDPVLIGLLQHYGDAVPYYFLDRHEKNSILVIGPGGGKEVLTALLAGVEQITAVEVNPDFVAMVKDYRGFNGGIYTDFTNVNVLVQEGRQYVKQTNNLYDLIVMVLPSTQQIQHIDKYALSENFLLTVEAINDYLDILTPEGRIIITVYNIRELKRLIVTAVTAFEKIGIDTKAALDHFKIIETRFHPTLVIKKNPYTGYDVRKRLEMMPHSPGQYPSITYLPHNWDNLHNTPVNEFILSLYLGNVPLNVLIGQQPFDLSPCYDDSPYFYKIQKGVPPNFLLLLCAVGIFNLAIVGVPYVVLKKSQRHVKRPTRFPYHFPLVIFMCIGLGFMIVQISLFQKLILYLGSPTISLSILLSSLLIGMGAGSYFGNRLLKGNHLARLCVVTPAIIIVGIAVILLLPIMLSNLLVLHLWIRATVTFLLILPFGFALGIPFPTSIQILKAEKMETLIPWMYGVNGGVSVFGSVGAVLLSMSFGFTPAFFMGIFLYFILFLFLYSYVQKQTGKQRITHMA